MTGGDQCLEGKQPGTEPTGRKFDLRFGSTAP